MHPPNVWMQSQQCGNDNNPSRRGQDLKGLTHTSLKGTGPQGQKFWRPSLYTHTVWHKIWHGNRSVALKVLSMGLRLDSSAVMEGIRSHYCFSSYYVAFPVGGIITVYITEWRRRPSVHPSFPLRSIIPEPDRKITETSNFVEIFPSRV